MIERRQQEQPTLSDQIMAWTGAFVAVAVTFMNAVTVYVVLTRPIPQDNETIVGQIMGSLLTSLGVVVGYFYVSGVGSRKKDETIATQAKTAQVAQAALPAVDGASIVLPPGETAKVTATEDGTEIKPTP